MGGFRIRRRRREGTGNQPAPGAPTRGISHDDLAEVDEHVIDLRDSTDARIESMAERVERLDVVISELRSIAASMVTACDRHLESDA